MTLPKLIDAGFEDGEGGRPSSSSTGGDLGGGGGGGEEDVAPREADSSSRPRDCPRPLERRMPHLWPASSCVQPGHRDLGRNDAFSPSYFDRA